MRVNNIRSLSVGGWLVLAALGLGCRSDLVHDDGTVEESPDSGAPGAMPGAAGQSGGAGSGGAPEPAAGTNGGGAAGAQGGAGPTAGASGAAGGAAGGPSETGGAGQTGAAGAPVAGAMAGAGGSTTPVMNPPPPPPADPTKFNFETDTQGWHDLRGTSVVPVQTMVQHFAGAAALEVPVVTTAPAGTTDANNRYVGVTADQLPAAVPAGTKLTYRVYYPAGAPLAGLQPFILDKVRGWKGTYKAPEDGLKPGMWNVIEVLVPADFQSPLELGVQFLFKGPWTGSVYVDSVTW